MLFGYQAADAVTTPSRPARPPSRPIRLEPRRADGTERDAIVDVVADRLHQRPTLRNQELYDGQGKKIITYPRAEVRYLPKSLIPDVPKIVASLQAGKSFSAIPVPDPPIIRKGTTGTFHDKDLRAPAITQSFRTSTRSTACGRSGRVFRSTRRNCST